MASHNRCISLWWCGCYRGSETEIKLITVEYSCHVSMFDFQSFSTVCSPVEKMSLHWDLESPMKAVWLWIRGFLKQTDNSNGQYIYRMWLLVTRDVLCFVAASVWAVVPTSADSCRQWCWVVTNGEMYAEWGSHPYQVHSFDAFIRHDVLLDVWVCLCLWILLNIVHAAWNMRIDMFLIETLVFVLFSKANICGCCENSSYISYTSIVIWGEVFVNCTFFSVICPVVRQCVAVGVAAITWMTFRNKKLSLEKSWIHWRSSGCLTPVESKQLFVSVMLQPSHALIVCCCFSSH